MRCVAECQRPKHHERTSPHSEHDCDWHHRPEGEDIAEGLKGIFRLPAVSTGPGAAAEWHPPEPVWKVAGPGKAMLPAQVLTAEPPAPSSPKEPP